MDRRHMASVPILVSKTGIKPAEVHHAISRERGALLAVSQSVRPDTGHDVKLEGLLTAP